jgi:hypothetical protein
VTSLFGSGIGGRSDSSEFTSASTPSVFHGG